MGISRPAIWTFAALLLAACGASTTPVNTPVAVAHVAPPPATVSVADYAMANAELEVHLAVARIRESPYWPILVDVARGLEEDEINAALNWIERVDSVHLYGRELGDDRAEDEGEFTVVVETDLSMDQIAALADEFAPEMQLEVVEQAGVRVFVTPSQLRIFRSHPGVYVVTSDPNMRPRPGEWNPAPAREMLRASASAELLEGQQRADAEGVESVELTIDAMSGVQLHAEVGFESEEKVAELTQAFDQAMAQVATMSSLGGYESLFRRMSEGLSLESAGRQMVLRVDWDDALIRDTIDAVRSVFDAFRQMSTSPPTPTPMPTGVPTP